MTRLRKSNSTPSCKKWKTNKNLSRNRSLISRFSNEKSLSEENSECRRLIESSKASKKKWVALSFFCALSFTQSYIWNTWSPISESVIIAYPTWTKRTVSMISSWGCISYLVCCFPACWILYRLGLLCPIRTAALLTTLATLLRCIFSQEELFTIAVHLAAILNGVAGVLLSAMTALVSAVWFPHGERTTATGISYAVNQLGTAMSYVIGPTLVKDIKSIEESLSERNFEFDQTNKSVNLEDDTFPEELLPFIRNNLKCEVMSLMRIEFVIQLLLMIGVLWFYPTRQPYQRPSAASYKDIGLLSSIMSLMKIKSIWLLCFSAALSQGSVSPWLNTITSTFDSSMTQIEADNLALMTIVLSSALSLIVSRIMDSFQGHLKIAINLLLATSALMFAWILLLDYKILTFQKKELYTATILGVSVCWSTSALFLELISEIAFPISEAIVGGYLIFFSNAMGCTFYMLQLVPKIGKWSTNYVLMNLILSNFLLFNVRDDYNRSKMDILEEDGVTLFNNKNKFASTDSRSERQIVFDDNITVAELSN